VGVLIPKDLHACALLIPRNVQERTIPMTPELNKTGEKMTSVKAA
jgi:hypothetical protein